LIDTEKHNLVSLVEKTGWHKRTINDSIKALDDIGISVEFVQKEGAGNMQGHYKITEWGRSQKSMD
jgi:hypothetical protein